MNSLELTRFGIILTMISVFLVSPEVFYIARELTWLNNVFKWIISSISNVRSITIGHISRTHRSEVREQLDEALKSGKPTKFLVRLTFSNLVPLISLIPLVLYIFCHLHVSVGILGGLFIVFFILMGIADVSAAHRRDKKSGKLVSGVENLADYFLVPPMFVLYMYLQGVLWLIAITAILSSSKPVRSWLAILGILMFFAGQTLQLVATFN